MIKNIQANAIKLRYPLATTISFQNTKMISDKFHQIYWTLDHNGQLLILDLTPNPQWAIINFRSWIAWCNKWNLEELLQLIIKWDKMGRKRI